MGLFRYFGAFIFIVWISCANAKIEGLVFDASNNAEGVRILSIRFNSMPGVLYELHKTNDLNEWASSGETLFGNGSQIEFKVSTNQSAEFYKIKEGIGPTFLSSLTEIEYPIHVHLPAGYENSFKDYPVIYATDGQWYSDSFSQEIERQGKEVILVAIEQGPNNRRATDYLLPGAETYFQFLLTELIPAIEHLYRADPDERSISGASYGGLFVGIVLLMDDVESPNFKNYLCFDASFWQHRRLTIRLEDERYQRSNIMNANLFLSSSLLYQSNDSYVSSFKLRLESLNYSGLNIIRKSYNVNHDDVGDPSFADALRLMFE